MRDHETELNIPFYYLGSRDYVNGLTIFEESLQTFLSIDGRASRSIRRISRFNVQKFIRNNCRLKIIKNDSVSAQVRKAAARIEVVTYDNTNWKLLLFERKNDPVVKRVADYDRSIYIESECQTSASETSVTLDNIEDFFSLVRGIVEANYRYCVNVAVRADVHQGVSWAYLTNFNQPKDIDVSSHPVITFGEKSIVRAYDKVFIIRNFSVNKLSGNDESEICFFFSDPNNNKNS
ncbi:MAG: hypothetical protein PVI94_28440 [Desulfobacterales bacterium]|jgi:hypothetical protein